MDQKSSPIILFIGVIVFSALIIGFWAMGVPKLFTGLPKKNPLSESKNGWQSIFEQAEEVKNSFQKTMASSTLPEEKAPTESELQALLLQTLGMAAQASTTIKTATTTVTSTHQ